MSLLRASILFRPRQKAVHYKSGFGFLVEAPGTAPGSAPSIPQGVYRHSRFPDTPNIIVNNK